MSFGPGRGVICVIRVISGANSNEALLNERHME